MSHGCENYRRVASEFWQVDKPPPTKVKGNRGLENKIMKPWRYPEVSVTSLWQVSKEMKRQLPGMEAAAAAMEMRLGDSYSYFPLTLPWSSNIIACPKTEEIKATVGQWAWFPENKDVLLY